MRAIEVFCVVAEAGSEPGGEEAGDETLGFEELKGIAVVFDNGAVLVLEGVMEISGVLREPGETPTVGVGVAEGLINLAEEAGEVFWSVLGGSAHAAGDMEVVVEVLEVERDLAELSGGGGVMADTGKGWGLEDLGM